MRELIKVLKAVSDKNRMRILKMLGFKNACVCELAAVLKITQPSVSKHLSLLKEAGLVTDERNGQWIDYALCTEKINQFAPALQSCIQGWLNSDPQIKQDLKTLQSLSRETICSK
ncbi:MAG: metalloregulator ArsR/SmtB family transcription factor [bacterium]|nr:metalloregulator ArsR/SmtB family transcription factor [bacterium]